MSKIYTGKGDMGTTSLADGRKVSKNHPQVVTYGKTDELIAWVGLIRSQPEFAKTAPLNRYNTILHSIQDHLMHIAALLASAKDKVDIVPYFSKAVATLEKTIDVMDSQLPALHSFILPSKPATSSIIHITRTVCRETERLSVTLGTDVVYAEILAYLNRLSDFFFVLARLVTLHSGCEEDFFV